MLLQKFILLILELVWEHEIDGTWQNMGRIKARVPECPDTESICLSSYFACTDKKIGEVLRINRTQASRGNTVFHSWLGIFSVNWQ